MSNVTNIRLRVLPRFPSRIVGANGFTVVREDADLVIKPDYGQLAVVPAVPDANETFFQAWTRDIDTYNIIPFSALVANIQDVIIGPNLSSIAELETATDTASYWTGEGEAGLYTVTDFVRTISASSDDASFRTGLGLGTAATEDATAFATAGQGALAGTALQPGEAATPTQGALADTAMQPTEYDPQGKAGDPFPYDTKALAEAANISADIHSIKLNGSATIGDGLGGLYIDTGTGSADTFDSADGRTWYRVADVGEDRLTASALNVGLERLTSSSRGLRSAMPLSLQIAGRTSSVRYITRNQGGVSLGGQTQGAAFDEVNRYWYELRGSTDGESNSQVNRYRMDGPVPQLSYDFQLSSPLTGHQTLGVQNYPDGSVKLWIASADGGEVLRFSYNPGGLPLNVEAFQVFDAGLGDVSLCTSWDQRYLIVRVSQSAGNIVRVFDLAALTAEGDVRGQQLFEWVLPDNAKPLQGACSDGEFLYTGYSTASVSSTIEIACFDLRTGELLDKNSNITVGLADALSSGRVSEGGLTFYELESLNCVKFDDGKKPQLVINTLGGDSARRRTLYHILDRGDQAWATKRSDAILRAMDSSSPSAARRQLIRETVSEYVRYGLWDGSSLLYFLAAHAEGVDLINWIDPGVNDLTRFGAGGSGFTANAGITGNTTRYLGLDLAYMNMVNYERDRAHIAVACSAPSSGLGPVVGIESGSYVRLDPRTASDGITSRLNSNASLDTAAGAGLTTPGIVAMDRNKDDGTEYALWKGNTKVKTVSMTLTTGNTVGHLVRLGKSDTSIMGTGMVLYVAEFRRPITDAQMLIRNRIWKNYMGELGVTLTL